MRADTELHAVRPVLGPFLTLTTTTAANRRCMSLTSCELFRVYVTKLLAELLRATVWQCTRAITNDCQHAISGL